MFQTNHTIYSNKYLLLTLWHIPVSHQLFYVHHSTGRWKQTKYSTYLLLTCMKYLYHTSYSTPLYRSVNTGHNIQYVAVNILLTCMTCLYYTCILSLLYRPVKTDRMRWVVLRTCSTSVYGSVTGSLHPHPVTDQVFCCVKRDSYYNYYSNN